MKLNSNILILAFIVATLSSCNHSAKSNEGDDENAKARTPVTVISISKEDISSTVTLNASSSFLKKSTLKSPVAGYIKEINVKIGEHVKTGQPVFTMQTKEAAAYKNLKLKDSTFNYSGMIHVRANSDGVVNNLPHVAGDYVQEGDELCSMAEQSSLVFLLEVPYEMHQYVEMNKLCTITLPDGRTIAAKIESKLSNMDSASQTERYVIRPSSAENIPENLLASILIVKTKKEKTVTLPKDAVLSNETQTEYWVMKIVNDSLAIKIPVHTGIRSDNKIEITEPAFTEKDRFVSSGSYGLPDSAFVTITK
jgi:multidrug efflux pump subunit AcrA (membrane-fusion protein)